MPGDRITAPEVRGVNPDPQPEEGELSEIEASGSPGGVPAGVAVSSEAPHYVELASQTNGAVPSVSTALGVPLKLQPANGVDVSCGVQALGMALDFLALTTEDETPTSAEMLSQLAAEGLLCDHGTGIEELAYIARQNGYAGSYSFHDWTLQKLPPRKMFWQTPGVWGLAGGLGYRAELRQERSGRRSAFSIFSEPYSISVTVTCVTISCASSSLKKASGSITCSGG